MKAEVKAVNAEKQRMETTKDFVQLNVRGQKCAITRSILCQVKGSLFAAMFSGMSEDRVERDQDGVAFLDFNPEYLGLILDYLRAKKISSPENPAVLAEVPKNQMKNFNTLLEYLGLSDEIVPILDPLSFCRMRNLVSVARGLLFRKTGKLLFVTQVQINNMPSVKMFINGGLYVSS